MALPADASPLVFIAAAPDDTLAFCLKQARHADPTRRLVVVTRNAEMLPKGFEAVDPQLFREEMPTKPDWKMLVRLLTAYCRHAGLGACWYLAPQTLLYDGLRYAEDSLTGVDLAGVELPEHLPTVLFARAQALEALIETGSPYPTLMQAADAAGLYYEPLEEVRMGQAFCAGLGQTEGFRVAEKDAGLKHLVWVQGQPFFVARPTGLVTRAMTLYLPGPLGRKLHQYYTGPGMTMQKLKAEARRLL